MTTQHAILSLAKTGHYNNDKHISERWGGAGQKCSQK